MTQPELASTLRRQRRLARRSALFMRCVRCLRPADLVITPGRPLWLVTDYARHRARLMCPECQERALPA